MRLNYVGQWFRLKNRLDQTSPPSMLPQAISVHNALIINSFSLFMSASRIVTGCFLIFVIAACQPAEPRQSAHQKNTTPQVLSPDVAFGAMFDSIQMARVFEDSKTLVDCTPKASIAEILKAWEQERTKADFDIKAFTMRYFEPPAAHTSGFKTDLSRTPAEHINALWPVLTRQADQAPREGSTLLPLPHPYVVPGGRFGEVYYWDSYFTMLGLQSAGRRDLIEHMIQNFGYLIDTYGHIPNGNRAYYLSRSQPPFFSLMVQLLDDMEQEAGIAPAERALVRYQPQLEKEYNFWMEGEATLTATQPANRRVVRMPDGALMNRYFDDLPRPRPESYREDVKTAAVAAAKGRPLESTYLDLKAAAESGWDFSSRWGVGQTLEGIQTTAIAPVDLNCLMWHLEGTLQTAFQRKQNTERASYYGARAAARKVAILRYCTDPNSDRPFYADVYWATGQRTTVVSMAGMFPMYFGLAPDAEGRAACSTALRLMLKPGGFVSTPIHTGQQWDAPNGWAPLQWVGISALRRYGFQAEAADVKARWVRLNTDVYQRTGKMLEKYNVEDLSLIAGGGEYPVQDGFGWSNGVLLRLLSEVEK
jgi:alpha,alpha-trehalase